MENLGPGDTVVLVNTDIVDTAKNMEGGQKYGDPVPLTAKLYSKRMFVVADYTLDGLGVLPMALLFETVDDGYVRVFVHTATGLYENFGSFRGGDIYVRAGEPFRGTTKNDMRDALVFLVNLLVLLNTPNYTVSSSLPRSNRRRLDKRFGGGTGNRVSVISWNLTKPKLETGESVGTGRHMPLHYSRGHWRRCSDHLPRAHVHDDGLARMWIEGFWSGHPAYGTVRSVYSPAL
jgi:hypothetical protein